MNKRRQIAVTLSTALFCWAAQMSAAAEPKKSTTVAYQNQPFDFEAQRLSPNFNGVDIRELARSLMTSMPREKSEFETTAAFQERVAAWSDRPILGSIMPSSTLAIVWDWSAYAELTYDADKAVMSVKFHDMHCNKNLGIEFEHTSKTLGRYVGQNAFGVKVNASTIEMNTLCMDGLIDIKGSFPMDASLARENKPYLKPVILARLREPYLEESTRYSTATIDAPVDIAGTYRHLKFVREGILLISTRTGELFRPTEVQATVATRGPCVPQGARDGNGNTRLHLAVWDQDVGCAKAILSHGQEVDINATNNFGATALHLAVANSNAALLKMLLDAGADRNAMDKQGDTPVSDAKKKSLAIQRLLQ